MHLYWMKNLLYAVSKGDKQWSFVPSSIIIINSFGLNSNQLQQFRPDNWSHYKYLNVIFVSHIPNKTNKAIKIFIKWK